MSADTPSATPPHIRISVHQLEAAIERVERRRIDLGNAPWPEIEKSIIRLLGGAFQPGLADHQAIALGLAGAYAARLVQEQRAFWFANREALEGAALGFPQAVLVLSPYAAVADALSHGDLSRLDAMAKEVSSSLAQASFSSLGTGTQLSAIDYQRIFDPGFIQFVALDSKKSNAVWASRPGQLIRDVQEALGRAGDKLPKQVRAQLEPRLFPILQRLDLGKTLLEQAAGSPRTFELMTHLFATASETGVAPEELWADVIFPLLHIGAPSQFPPLDAADLEAFGGGLDPVLLFVDLVPYRIPAPEDGLLGAFPHSDLAPLYQSGDNIAAIRLVKVKGERLHSLLAEFDPNAVRAAVKQFTEYAVASGKLPFAPTESTLLEPALRLLSDLKVVCANSGGSELCIRSVTELEALLEPGMDELRRTLQGPRIILL
jgi:hypothetical protein